MVSSRANKVHAAFDKLDLALDRIAALPPDDLTLDDRLTLWAHLETLRLALVDAVQRGRRAAL
ncbi:MAG: hypothetical protein QOE48_4262 [Mycobacterium sp.]|jgi:hypothetical protein|nr:hypothetical protein [Mycobacterium sp.]